jgi:hypothetical protein
MHFCGMAIRKTSEKSPSAIGFSAKQGRVWFPKARFFLRGSLLMGTFALLSSQASGQADGPGYGRSSQRDMAHSRSHVASGAWDATDSAESNAVPLLLLAFVGLAGLALSRTRSSNDDRN